MYHEMCNKYILTYSSIILYSVLSILLLYFFIRKESTKKFSDGANVFKVKDCNMTVEIWGKASISLYLWEHILEGNTNIVASGLGKTGQLLVDALSFTFRYGPQFIQTTVPSDVEYLVLVLNGRSPEKIKVAKEWLDYLPRFTKLNKLAVILLGDEKCNNQWITPYFRSTGGMVDVLFLVYDSLLVDNDQVHQWPLGVAQYRGFQNIPPESINISSKRKYACNFAGTLYKNSSRSTLSEIINSVSALQKCPVVGRKEWKSTESEQSLKNYIKLLEDSDLTLCPVGYNSECYRVYEALSLGSVPVLEDVATGGNCDREPFRLLKRFNPPFIFIKHWNELPNILKTELSLPQRVKKRRRKAILEWYTNFKKKLKEHFIRVINKKFCPL